MPRQLCTLNAFCDNLEAIKQRVWSDAEKAGLDSEPISIEAGGRGAQAYAEAITIYLSLAIDRFADYWTSFGRWQPANQQLSNTFSVQGIAMAWDFPEANPFSGKGGSFKNLLEWTLQSLPTLGHGTPGKGEQADAGTLRLPDKVIVSTDPPYYDNVGYSDLSDFFYCWLKKNLKHLYPSLFGTITTPKFNEIFACSTRHGGRDEAEHFFLNAMTQAMTKLTEIIHPCYPATIYYAFKQSEAKNSGGVYSTGWETFLEAIVNAGMTINSTWPLRTEMANRMASIDSNSLSASILLVCEARSVAPVAVSRADFRRRLRARLADAMKLFKRAGILPVDIAQSVIGTGFSLYSGAEQVINPDDSPMSVRDALIEINSALDTYLGEDEADLDSETRLALTFFESYGYEERPYGDAEGLAIARNLSVDGVAEAGILSSVAGKVRLYQRAQLPDDWDPTTDRRLCVWEATQHLINRLEASGEGAAAELLLQLKNVSGHGDLAANCRALAYRLYNHCEKKKLAEEARSYNGLVIAWPELERLASASSTSSSAPRQTTLI